MDLRREEEEEDEDEGLDDEQLHWQDALDYIKMLKTRMHEQQQLIQRQTQLIQQQLLCGICVASARTMMVSPCNHLYACESCATRDQQQQQQQKIVPCGGHVIFATCFMICGNTWQTGGNFHVVNDMGDPRGYHVVFTTTKLQKNKKS